MPLDIPGQTARRTALLVANGFVLAEGWQKLLTNEGAQEALRLSVLAGSWLAGLGLFFSYFSLVFQDKRPAMGIACEWLGAGAFLFGCLAALIHLTLVPDSPLVVLPSEN
jgi:hypothetical protein